MEARAPALPERIHRYQVLSELGRGSMGRVYLALDPNIDRRIALKVLRRYFANDEEEADLHRREVPGTTPPWSNEIEVT